MFDYLKGLYAALRIGSGTEAYLLVNGVVNSVVDGARSGVVNSYPEDRR